jgi:enoyl-CoA hydratase/carnithine racemase
MGGEGPGSVPGRAARRRGAPGASHEEEGFRTLRFAIRDAVATITLNRPEVLNAYDIAMRDDLYAVLGAVADDPGIRAVVVRGAGRAFCSGGDVTEFGTAPSPLVARWVRWRRDVWGALRSLRAITIAAVHGHAAGSGLEMALLCDLLVVADGAVLSLPECALAMIPGVGGTQTLPRAVGVGRALDMLLTGRRIDGREAVRIALANRCVPRADLDAVAQGLAERIATLPPVVAAAIKHCVNQGAELSMSAGLALERRVAAALAAAQGRHP